MNGALCVVDVGELDFALEPTRWTFAQERATDVAAHWAKLLAAKPALYNGRVLLLGRRELVPRSNGGLRLNGVFFETTYADYVAWRAFGHPGEPVDNCFSMAALRGADGAFLLGEMASHTYNAGQIYFPSGTPDPTDVFDGKVDLDASVRRELLEETGLSADAGAMNPGWTVVFAPQRVACMKLISLALSAEEAKARIETFLSADPDAEFARVHVVGRLADIDEARTPAFVSAYLHQAFG